MQVQSVGISALYDVTRARHFVEKGNLVGAALYNYLTTFGHTGVDSVQIDKQLLTFATFFLLPIITANV